MLIMSSAQLYAFISLIILQISVTLPHNIEYTDLQTLGAACDPRDTCEAEIPPIGFLNRNCECDSRCREFGDCCVDAKASARRRPIYNFKCMEYDSEVQGVYAISECPPNWNGSAVIRQRCESATRNISDPVVSAPNTDPNHNITYKNRFCAECNNAHIDHLQTWSIDVSCPSLAAVNLTGNITASYIESNLTYSPSAGKWGLNYWNATKRGNSFYKCKLNYVVPSYIQESVRLCRPRVISTCARGWRREVIRRRCMADYMAVVYTDNGVYKNPHCALCNNFSRGQFACTTGALSRRRPPMSFTLLLDVNTKDGSRVGAVEDQRCTNGEKWDPFFKKCRVLVCALPGFVMVDGKCQQQQ